MSDSLPQALLQQAKVRPDRIALRYKQLGIWQTRNWGELAQEVSRLAAGLRQLGLDAGHSLIILSDARAEALLLTLAAHWVGASVSLLDPSTDNREALSTLAPTFAVAEGQGAVLQLRAVSVNNVVVLDRRGLDDSAADNLIDYDALLQHAPIGPLESFGSAPVPAFLFTQVEVDAAHQTVVEFSHADLLLGAQQLVDRQGLSERDQALAARVFAASGQARYLLAPWLVAGFCLNFPEALSTRDNDRRELGPTLVLGTRESYARLERWAHERLPLPGTFSHGLYQWAMAPAPGVVQRWLGHWLIRRPLLDVLGMTRLSKPLLVGDALTAQSEAFFAALGIRPRALGSSAPVLAASPLLHTPEPFLMSASS